MVALLFWFPWEAGYTDGEAALAVISFSSFPPFPVYRMFYVQTL